MEQISFKTRARTVDHLGREQIADCPTAISELWKNAFDAYARIVSLDIFDGETPVAVMTDDGHGMNLQEFQERWFVVGTESKTSTEGVPKADRNGLPERVKQGQKGIGRLSCANLGPVLLLISKRTKSPFVASLLDWRLFENPYLNLSDIFIPITETKTLDEVFENLPIMIQALAGNIRRDASDKEDSRIVKAWQDFDQLPERIEGTNSGAILSSIQSIKFNTEQLCEWSLSDGIASHGTALMVAEINYDLRAQLAESPYNPAIQRTRENFFETLTSFVDPYIDPDDETTLNKSGDFQYAVRTWKNASFSLIVGKDNAFTRRQIEDMEHCILGHVDEYGVFRGYIKAFGNWLPDRCEIRMPHDVPIPNRSDTKVGSFEIFISSMEFVLRNSTHDAAHHKLYQDLAKKYAGFLIFRDALRVLPYGRTDNDFFEIESRRSKSAGREFWNHRQMFGRIALERDRNPNLIDKAGREGLLDNRASKALKGIVDNLLQQSARKYFGSASPYRKSLLPDIQDAKDKLRVAENKRKLREKNRRQFSTRLKQQLEILPNLIDDIEIASAEIVIETDKDLENSQETLAQLRKRLPSTTLPGAPRSMSKKQKENYSTYRNEAAEARGLYAKLSQLVEAKVEDFKPADPLTVLESQLQKSKRRLATGINEWTKSIVELQRAEYDRVKQLAANRNSMFEDEANAILQLFIIDRETFASASKKLTLLQETLGDENDAIFEPYVRGLESLKESIDLEHLATSGMEELADARAELERLNSLAQLGIAVEITGHDLQDFDDIIAAGLKRLPKEVQNTRAVRDITLGYEGLTDQLRFLSPLRLAGVKVERWIDGAEIFKYISEFFAPTLAKNKINLKITNAFSGMRVFDQPSRLFPVFINLVNNSIYWLSTSTQNDRKIIFDIVNGSAVVSDNGPGIDVEDIENLFKLFFTRKLQGGRGVGLYLTKANLVAGGHNIEYIRQVDNLPLGGANFLITFNGAEYLDE